MSAAGGDRFPYVGSGEEGTRRSAQIDREEADGLSWINEAMNELGLTLTQFYSLRHPGTTLGNVTPTIGLQWVSMFQVPWYSDGWQPPDDCDQL